MKPISAWFETREDALVTMRPWCGWPDRPDDFFPPYPALMISSNRRDRCAQKSRRAPRRRGSQRGRRRLLPRSRRIQVLPRHRHAFSRAMQKADDMERNNKFV
jgi:hypothetical protein